MARFNLPVRAAGNGGGKGVAVISPAGAKASIGAKAGKAAGKATKLTLKGFMWGMAISELLDLLSYISPEKLAQLYALAEKLGIPLEELKGTVDETTAQLIWALAAQAGFTPDELTAVGIHQRDVETYAKVAVRYTLENRDAHDAMQVNIVEDETDIDRMARLKPIAYACDRLMLTGPARARQLYMLAMVVNSIKDEHVEEFEHHERTWGRVPSDGVVAL